MAYSSKVLKCKINCIFPQLLQKSRVMGNSFSGSLRVKFQMSLSPLFLCRRRICDEKFNILDSENLAAVI